ncbi:hypothetical protein GCM10009648_18480 [Tsukamurella spumae]
MDACEVAIRELEDPRREVPVGLARSQLRGEFPAEFVVVTDEDPCGPHGAQRVRCRKTEAYLCVGLQFLVESTIHDVHHNGFIIVVLEPSGR